MVVGYDGVMYRTINGGGTPVESITQNDLVSVYPNPAQDFIQVETKSNDLNTASYKLMNQSGIEVLNGDVNSSSFSIDITQLSSGIYYLNLIGNDMIINQKIVITK